MVKKIIGNIENMIGWTRIPLGQAGPLAVNGQEYTLPLATTEGALVASINRGCKAIRLSGGAKAEVEAIGASRGPVFRVKGISQGRSLIGWVRKNFSLLQKVAEATSSHLKLNGFKPAMVGKSVWLRFCFDTSEAMGMNMVTIATEAIVQLIKQRLKLDCLALSGNFCVDKKPSWLNFIAGRGKRTWAEVIVPNSIVKQVLKTKPERIVQIVQQKQWLGSIMAGSMGFNGHYANIVAAIFLATGQDVAQVTEASLGITTAELVKRDLYFSVYLPDLMVGTVGGGTGLPSQQRALKMLGNPKVMVLAEIIAGAVLAGELSLTAALASADLAQAHEKLGRPK